MGRVPVFTFAALLAITLFAAGCGGGGSSCPTCGPTEPPTPPTVTQGMVSNYDNDDPLDDLTQLYFYPYTGSSVALKVPDDGIEVDVDDDGNYRTTKVGAGTWMVRGHRVGYEMFDQGPVEVFAETTNNRNFEFMPLPSYEYITTLGCAQCHPVEADIFSRNAHPYKINKVVNDEAPTYPFSALPDDIVDMIDGAINTLGAPDDWDDLTYVIGGYHWKARFMDANGYIVIGSDVQYNYETDEMVAYHDSEDDVDKVFNCGNCHTTGWRHTDAQDNPNNQDDLVGITGTWSEPGIQCEACHGGGALHSQTMNPGDITLIAPGRLTGELQEPMMGYGLAQSCADCHTRDGEKDWRGQGDLDNFFSNYQLWAKGDAWSEFGGRIAASGGLIKHHEQYDEIIGLDPDDSEGGPTHSSGYMAAHGDCLTCHRVHETTVNQDVSGDLPGVLGWDGTADQPYKANCINCHDEYDPADSGSTNMSGFDCVDCHMPKLAKSAVAHAPAGTGEVPSGPVLGDIATHIFKINLDVEVPQFTEDGGFSYPYITYAYACRKCHNGEGAFDRPNSGGYIFHKNVDDDDEEEEEPEEEI